MPKRYKLIILPSLAAFHVFIRSCGVKTSLLRRNNNEYNQVLATK